MRRVVFALLSLFFLVTVFGHPSVVDARTCCVDGNDPKTCWACSGNDYKNHGGCVGNPTCVECPADTPVANACAGGGGIDMCSLFKATPTATVQVGSTSGFLSILVKQGTYSTITVANFTPLIATANPVIWGSAGLPDLGNNYTTEVKRFKVTGLRPGVAILQARQYSTAPGYEKLYCTYPVKVTVLAAPTPAPTPVTDPTCTCTAWASTACWPASCPVGMVQQTRTCSPVGCQLETQCVKDPNCDPVPSTINAVVYTDSPTNPAKPAGLANPNCSTTTPGIYQAGGTMTATDNTGKSYSAALKLANGAVTITNVPQSTGGKYCVRFTSLDPDYAVTCPSSGEYCSQDAPIPPATPLRFYVSKIGNPWYQTMGGDIGAMNGSGTALTDAISAPCKEPGCLPYLALPLGTNPSSTGALLTSTSSVVNMLTGSIAKAPEARRVKLPNPLVCRENYDYFYRLFSMGLTPNSDFVNPANAILPAVPLNGVAYYYGGGATLTVSTAWNIKAGESKVVFVKGDLSIKNTITVAKGGFLAFIVSGNIIVDPSVGTLDHSSTTNGQVQGVYISNQMIQVLPQGVNIPDKKLVAEGTFAACNGIQIKRDFYGVDNNRYPGALFVYRPDFVLNTPAKMKESNYIWQEVAAK